MPRTPSLSALDKALAIAAGLASKSTKLSPAEKRELRALAAKGAKRGRQGLTMADRARCAWLIRKAGPETVPDIRLPERLKRVLGLTEPVKHTTEPPYLLGRTDPAVDPIDRLEKLGRLRGKPLTDEQFDRQRSRILMDPAIGSFGMDDGVDPLDRLTRVGELEAAGILTSDQAAELTERILDAP
jgi:hypothetical protein